VKAHPNIIIIDESLTREDIEAFYSKAHADVWNLIRTAGLAANMRPPVFEVVSLSARHGEHTAQARGKRQVEPGWTEVYPEEDMTLCRELPEDPSLLEALASGPLAIERADVIETRIGGAGPLGVADLIRVMKDEKVGRPSTYASHVEAMFECVDIGWLSFDEAGRFRMTEAGRVLLDVLADPALPQLGKSYTAELEADLDAIEQGEKSPAQVLRRHLGRLPGVETNIPANALETISESDEPDENVDERFQPGPPINAAALPAELDPETVLAPSHPLRALRSAFDAVIRDTFGHAHPNRAEASRRKACRARALGWVMGNLDAERLVERLQLDLGWRWVVGLAPSDRAWSVNAFVSLVMNEEDLVDKLVVTGEQALSAAGRSSLAATPSVPKRAKQTGDRVDPSTALQAGAQP
jgi:hypothetical protein